MKSGEFDLERIIWVVVFLCAAGGLVWVLT